MPQELDLACPSGRAAHVRARHSPVSLDGDSLLEERSDCGRLKDKSGIVGIDVDDSGCCCRLQEIISTSGKRRGHMVDRAELELKGPWRLARRETQGHAYSLWLVSENMFWGSNIQMSQNRRNSATTIIYLLSTDANLINTQFDSPEHMV